MRLPLVEGFEYDFWVDWGVGKNAEHVTTWDGAGAMHAYEFGDSGRYNITILGTEFPTLRMLSLKSEAIKNFQKALIFVHNLGGNNPNSGNDIFFKYHTLEAAFSNCVNLKSVRTDGTSLGLDSEINGNINTLTELTESEGSSLSLVTSL